MIQDQSQTGEAGKFLEWDRDPKCFRYPGKEREGKIGNIELHLGKATLRDF